MGKKVLTLDVLISKEIEYILESEGYEEGDILPSERKLAEQFGVHRLSLRSALQILIQKGILISQERRGYFVAPRRVKFDLNEYKSTKAFIEKMGKETFVKLLEFERIKVGEKLAKRMLLPEDSQVYRTMRLRYESKTPMSLERAYILCEMAEGLEAEDVHNKSLYDTLKKKFNITVASAKQKVTVVYASGLESELLKVSPLKPLMRYQGYVYDKKGRLIEYFDDVLLMEKVEFISSGA